MEFDLEAWKAVGGLAGGGGIGIIVWFIRLEGRVKALERENNLLQTTLSSAQAAQAALSEAHGALNLKLSEELGKFRECLARIEGKLAGIEGRLVDR